MNKPIYLDYAATTPVDPRVAEKLVQFLTMDGIFANPASRSHIYGWQAEAAVEHARKQVAGLLSSDTREIVWTSGATESNNLAIKGVCEKNKDKGSHIITKKLYKEEKWALYFNQSIEELRIKIISELINSDMTLQQIKLNMKKA